MRAQLTLQSLLLITLVFGLWIAWRLDSIGLNDQILDLDSKLRQIESLNLDLKNQHTLSTDYESKYSELLLVRNASVDDLKNVFDVLRGKCYSKLNMADINGKIEEIQSGTATTNLAERKLQTLRSESLIWKVMESKMASQADAPLNLSSRWAVFLSEFEHHRMELMKMAR